MKITETLLRLWNSEYSLAKTFWFFGVLPFVLFPILFCIIIGSLKFLLGINSFIATVLVTVATILTVAYELFVLASIWRLVSRNIASKTMQLLLRILTIVTAFYMLRVVYISIIISIGAYIRHQYGNY